MVSDCPTNAGPEWIEILVPVKVALADGVAAMLVEHVDAARGGVQIRKGEIVFWVTSAEVEATLAEVRVALRTLANEGWLVDEGQVRAGQLAPEAQWRDAWKSFFHTIRLTRQIVVVPTWESHQATDTDLCIQLDPGQAFGTGAHASTQLVLLEMQGLVDESLQPAPATIFDLGTGSGILAIAAARFWPDVQVTATDIDPMSIKATVENANINNVGDRISASTTPLQEITSQFPLLLANLQAHILRDQRDDLLPRLAPGATLIVSGILSSQIRPLSDFYCATNVLVVEAICQSQENAEWSCARLRRVR